MIIILSIIYILLFVIFAFTCYTILQIKLSGMSIRDFLNFVKEAQEIDVLYRFSKKYERITSQEQLVFLLEAEKLFNAFDKVPSQIWEDEYDKYEHILDAYRNIKMTRWAEANAL